MPHRQQHRGAHPEDRRLFAPAVLPTLRAAYEEAAWLRGRDYPLDVAVRVVGEHHQLDVRQRVAIRRSLCSPAERGERLGKCLPPEAAADGRWEVDGFNLIISLEVALSGGVLLRGADGALRDLAGLRGSYHVVDETAGALALVGRALATWRAPAVRIWLDAPVANSGRLRSCILGHAERWPCSTSVELVPDADRELVAAAYVISGDSAVLDRCRSWLNVAAWLVASEVPQAWVVDLTA